jgi:hypothetical protein
VCGEFASVPVYSQSLLGRYRFGAYSLHAAIDKRGPSVLMNIARDSEKGLPNSALMIASDLADESDAVSRVDSVHQVKGESLDAVLYLASKEHVTALLAGVASEVGRIGYVALTRARNLLWLGVPADALAELRPTLLDHGFQEVGTAAPTPNT